MRDGNQGPIEGRGMIASSLRLNIANSAKIGGGGNDVVGRRRGRQGGTQSVRRNPGYI